MMISVFWAEDGVRWDVREVLRDVERLGGLLLLDSGILEW